MNKFVFSITFCLISGFIHTQTPADCIGAEPICSSTYILPVLPTETDAYTGEINPGISCLATYDQKGRWYKFASTGAGVLNFSIHPIDTTYDFDWALFKMTNRDCSEIWSDLSIAIGCNFYGVQGNNGSTGANGLSGGQNSPAINVDTATLFYLYISSYALASNDSLGYIIDFTQTTFSMQGCDIISVEEYNLVESLKLFPNPASTVLNYQTDLDFSFWIIRDMHGRVINQSSAKNKESISIASYPAGVYLFEIHSEGGIVSKKFLKYD